MKVYVLFLWKVIEMLIVGNFVRKDKGKEREIYILLYSSVWLEFFLIGMYHIYFEDFFKIIFE